MADMFSFSQNAIIEINKLRLIAAREANSKAEQFAGYIVNAFNEFHRQGPYQNTKLHLSVVLVKQLSLAMFEDLLRMQAYHPIERPTRYKYAAFAFKWITKCRPIKPIMDGYNYDARDYECLSKANAYFAMHFIFAFLDKCNWKKIPPCVFRELAYTGTFRSIHPEQLALTLEHIEKTYCLD